MSAGPPSQTVSLGAEPRVVPMLLPSVHAAGSENYALRLVESAGSERFSWHVVSMDPRRGDLHDAFAATENGGGKMAKKVLTQGESSGYPFC